MSTDFLRNYIDIIKEAEEPRDNEIAGYVENSTNDLVYLLKLAIEGNVPSVDNLVDSLNDAYSPDVDADATTAYIRQNPVAYAVRDICADLQVALDEDDDDEESIMAQYMPRIKKAYQMAISNGYSTD